MFTPTIERVSADDRGEIYAITLPDDQEFLLLHSRAGSLRGGHSHDVDERVCMLTGKMRYHKKSTGKMRQDIVGVLRTFSDEGQPTDQSLLATVVKAGETSYNYAHEIHMGEFLEDSWLLEYKLNTKKGAWVNSDYAPWREKVTANTAG